MKKRVNKKKEISSLEIKREKEKVLDYIKGQNLPLVWSKIFQRFHYAERYTAEAYQPLKDWYNKLYEELMDEFSKTLTANKQKVPFDIAISKPVFNLDKDNLNTLLIKSFKYYKTIVEETFFISNNFNHNQYFINFFNTFIPKLSSCCILKNSSNYLNPYHQVYNLETFKEYLKQTPGLYSQMAIWAIDNPFLFSSSMISQEHHVQPVFLSTEKYNIFSLKEIEQPYNKVQVSLVVHILLHVVRLIEYNQVGDYKALTVIAGMVRRKPEKSLTKF